jgi:beta-lactamase regulating signal transducer with metallopeptidase domain
MTFIKGSIVFIIVYIALAVFKNLPAEFKHLIWFAVICGFILIPLFSFFSPLFDFRVPMLTNERAEILNNFTTLLITQAGYQETAGLSSQSGAVLTQLTDQAPRFSLHWTFWAALIWVIGIIISSLRTIFGRISLYRFRKRVPLTELNKYNPMIKQISNKMGINRKVEIIKSAKCKIPFAANVFKPIIVFPSDMDSWSIDRVRVVLTHELAHIRRRDYLTQYITRVLASIFWFMPAIWIAYSNLHLEQEKACDSSVVDTGEAPVDYAGQLLDLAYFHKRRFLPAGLFITKGKKMLLEKRILSVLSAKGNNLSKKGKRITIRGLALVIASILAVIVMIGSCAATKRAVSKNDFFETWSGTWASLDIARNALTPQKLINHSDGTQSISTFEAKMRVPHYTITLIDQWIDLKGNIWYKAQRRCEWGSDLFHGTIHEYGKISDSGNTLELLYHVGTIYVEEWEPYNPLYNYAIYYRI